MVNKFILPNYQQGLNGKPSGGAGPGPGIINIAKPIFKFWVECSGNNHNLVK